MSLINILNELSTLLGREVVVAECLKFTTNKKERKPRGKSSWNIEVDTVLADMRSKTTDNVTYKMAFAEASRRRRLNNPELQARYDATHPTRPT
jgi:hypothetical protein